MLTIGIRGPWWWPMRAESPQSCHYRPSTAAPSSTSHPVINAISLIVGLLFESLGHTGKSWVFSLHAFFPNNCVSLVVEHDVMSSDEGVALEKLKIVPKGLTEPVQLTSHKCIPVATHVQTVTLKLTKQACGSFTLWSTKQACGSCYYNFTLYLLREHWEIKSSFSPILFRLGIQYLLLLLFSWSEVNAKTSLMRNLVSIQKNDSCLFSSQTTWGQYSLRSVFWPTHSA